MQEVVLQIVVVVVDASCGIVVKAERWYCVVWCDQALLQSTV